MAETTMDLLSEDGILFAPVKWKKHPDAIALPGPLVKRMWDAQRAGVAADREYGGWVFRLEDGTFWYSDPLPGLERRFVNRPERAAIEQRGIDADVSSTSRWLEANRPLLKYHTHAFPGTPSAGHSGGDIQNFLRDASYNITVVATPQYLFALVRTHKTTENRFLDVPDGLVTSEQDPDHYRDAWLRLNLPRADEHKFCIYFGVWPSGTVIDDTALRLRYIPS